MDGILRSLGCDIMRDTVACVRVVEEAVDCNYQMFCGTAGNLKKDGKGT